MTTVGIRTLRSKLTEFLHLVATGTQTIDIACRGKVVAKLVAPNCQDGVLAGDQNSNSFTNDKPFTVTKTRSLELRRQAQQKYRELEQMTSDNLIQKFTDATSLEVGMDLSQRELRIAIARIHQLNLWLDQMGAVPCDIARRDLQFWLHLLNRICTQNSHTSSAHGVHRERH